MCLIAGIRDFFSNILTYHIALSPRFLPLESHMCGPCVLVEGKGVIFRKLCCLPPGREVRIQLFMCKLLFLAIILNVSPKWVMSSYLPLESSMFGPCGQGDAKNWLFRKF